MKNNWKGGVETLSMKNDNFPIVLDQIYVYF